MNDTLASILRRFAVVDQETAKGAGPRYVGVICPNGQVITFSRDRVIAIYESMDPVYAYVQADEGTALCLEEGTGAPMAGLVA